jgi:putative ABC transport system permease protein
VTSVGTVWVGDGTAPVQMLPTVDPTRPPPRFPVAAVDAAGLATLEATVSSPRLVARAWASSAGDPAPVGDVPAPEGLPSAVIGATAARRLGLSELDGPVVIRVAERPVEIIAVLLDARAPELLLAIVFRPDDAVDVWRASGIDEPAPVVTMAVTPGAAQSVAELVPLTLSPHAPHNVSVSAPPSAEALRNDVEGSLAGLLSLIIVVALLAGIAGIAGTMTASVLQRTTEIGLRRALGARKHHIFAQILTETVALGMAGGVIGLLLGILVVGGVSAGRGWPPQIPPSLLVAAPFVGILTSAVAGLYPAGRAARQEPVEALRG